MNPVPEATSIDIRKDGETDDSSVSAGARWMRTDLHLHTPGVQSFAAPAGSDVRTVKGRERLSQAYVKRLVTAGIQVAAITDYQGVREPWFRAISTVAADHGIVVLPGAEMSLAGQGKGIHILLVCDPGTPAEEINETLRAQDQQGGALFDGRAEARDILLRETLEEALVRLRRRLGCVIIAAHPTEKNGIIRCLGPQQSAT